MTVPIEVPGDLVGAAASAPRSGPAATKDLRPDRSPAPTAARPGARSAEIAGPTPGTTEHFRFDDWPAGTRKVLLRFELTGNNTVGVQSFRVDADYRDPLAAKTARPFRVVHRWKEGGRERSHAETIARLPATYTIQAGAEPEMVSVTYEMPATR